MDFVKQKITETLETNYMPYAMSVIISRAIPEIDGFKPSHRKLLYTMYKMGLLNGPRTKSANVVGQTMKLNPHGDAAIYETMVRLSRGYEALLYPYVDSKGNFGKQYSRDMAYAASRYTEVKLASICAELFRDIDRDTVDFIDNYDNTLKEPTLLPVSFPNILVAANQGIAVGMASNICSFNLAEVCETTAEYLTNPNLDLLQTLKAPDFSTGGYLLYDQKALRTIYETGRGGLRLRAKYTYDKKENCIEITEIPYTTTVEAIIEKIVELVKGGKIREISDIRDETDLSGLRITIDLKRGVDADKLMARLFKMTPLEDTFSCNFNVLLGSMAKVCSVKEILEEWSVFRIDCLKRQMYHDMQQKQDKLHLMRGLEQILLDIDKAIRIVRETENEDEVVPNLMIGFGIDEVQAEYVAEIKLRNLNKQYILKQIDLIETLEKEIAELESTISDKGKIKRIIAKQLREIGKKYGGPRKTDILYDDQMPEVDLEEQVDDYAVNLFLTKDGYFKKITPLSLRMGGEHKLKEGDLISQSFEASNRCDILVFTDQQQVYKARVQDFEDGKASLLGEYLPVKLGMDQGENVVSMAVTADYKGSLMLFFRDGKAARIQMDTYATKTNRRKLTSAYSGKAPLVFLDYLPEGEADYVLESSSGKTLVLSSAQIPEKSTRTSQGVAALRLSGKHYLFKAMRLTEEQFQNPNLYRARNLPAAGKFLDDGDKRDGQVTL